MTTRDAQTQVWRKGLAALAIALTMGPALLFAAGYIRPAEAHGADQLPTQTGGHNTTDAGFWNVVEGMTTKTGFRMAFWWDTDAPVAGVVEWGFDGVTFPNTVLPIGDTLDSAQMAFSDIPATSVVPGKTVFFRVHDLVSGALSPVKTFPLGNAWKADATDGVYEINAVFQLDTEALPDNVPLDQGMVDMAKAIDILAERVWDASDGYVRLGKILVTDTVTNYPVNYVQFPVGLCTSSFTASGGTVGNTLADFIVTTQYPFDSHTFKDGINCPGFSFYVGRIGQLVVPWEDEFHMGSVLTHEFGHYAFGMDDLYEFPVSNGCFTGLGSPPSNANNNWDISVMSNAFGFNGARWLGSEFDRVGTPCDRRGGSPSWPFLVARYPAIPATGRLGNDLPDHSDSVYNQAKDNPDGGKLDVFFLDNEVAGLSKVNHYLKAPTDSTDPVIAIEQPENGAAVPPAPLVVSGQVNMQVANTPPVATLGASPNAGQAPLTVTFTAAASDSDGAIASWSLTYGDGGSNSGTGGPPASLSHTYTADGDYTATLTVTDDLGATAQAQRGISVGLLASATRIGTDVAGDTATTCPTANPGGCNTAWVAGAKDGLDIRAAYVSDRGTSIRFLIQVQNGDAFFVDPAGDPTGATEAGQIMSYQMTVQFQTSPGTVYTVNINRADGSSSITAQLGKRFGVLISNANLGAAQRQGNLFWADVPKTQFPEMAALKTLSGFGGSTAFVQRGATVQLIQTMDTLGTIETTSVVVTELDLPGYGANPAAALPAPSEPPANPHIDDGTGDVLFVSDFTDGVGAPVDHMDIEAAWFENDADYLYMGIKVKDIPADTATTAQIAYDVEFVPGWTSTWPGVASGASFTGLRVEALLSPVAFRGNDIVCEDCLPEPFVQGTETQFELHVMSFHPTFGGFFNVLSTLPLSTIDAETDILWFVIPRTVLQDPAAGDVLDAPFAYSQQGMTGLFTSGWDSGDFAEGPATEYVVQGVNVPLAVDAGGPYTGVVGGAFPIAATATGGNPPYDCAWSGPASASFLNANACLTSVTFSAVGDHTLSVTVTDDDGDTAVDTAPATVIVESVERVEVLLDGALQDSVPVSTSAGTPVDDWLTTVDLTGAAFGEHTIDAVWLDEDDNELDRAQVTVEVTGGPPFITIAAPADGSVVTGIVPVNGLVGHTGGPPATPSGSELVTVEVDGVVIDTIPVDTSLGDDAWGTNFNADAAGPGTHLIEATFDDGLGGLVSASVSVQVPMPPAPFVTIDTPGEGATLAIPADFAGTFSTTGDPPAEPAGEQGLAAAGPLVEWSRDPFVASTLTSEAFAALRDQLASHDGFLSAYPSAADGGKVVALFDGAIPGGLPTEFSGHAIEYKLGEARPLMIPAGRVAQNHVSLEEFVAMSDAEREAWLAQGSHETPDGPKSPVQADIGPGTALQQVAIGTDPLDGQKKLLTFICTASFLFEDPATGKYYLATAGHCLLDEDVVSSVATPAARARSISFCVSGCINNWIGLGNYIDVTPAGAYHPVAFAHQQGVGRDFGLIEIPAALQPLLRPWMAQWGGPVASDNPAVGDPIVHFGHGVGTGMAPGEQGRLGVTTRADRVTGIDVAGASFGGDSGSAFGTAFPRGEKLAVGDGAAGTLTHGYGFNVPLVGFVPIPEWAGTHLEGGLDMAQGPLGFRPVLVTESATIRAPGQGTPPFEAAITGPVDGAVIDPLDGRFASISGTGQFPPGALPGTATRTYFVHRGSCGTPADRLWLDEVRGAAADGGDGCGKTFAPAGYVVEQALGELADTFVTDPKPTATTFLDPIRNIEVTMVLTGFRGASQNPQPVPTVVSDLEVRLFAGDRFVGGERKIGPLALGADRPVTFSFPAEVPTVSPTEGLRLVFVVHEAAGHVFVRHGGASSSFMTVPLGLDPGNAVDVSLDDPTFLTGLLPTTGSESWSATWDLQGALPGPHTIYARARQGDDVSASVDSIGVTLSSVVTPPTAGFTPTVDGLAVTFTDASTPGDLPLAEWAWDLGDGATATGASVAHLYSIGGTYDVRLVVTDEGGYADDVEMSVEVGDDWSLDVRIVDPLGAEVLGWTPAADPVDGGAGSWAFQWDTATPPTNGAYRFESRLVREGGLEASASRDFALLVNHAPVLASVGPQTVAESSTLTLQLSATDPDGDLVTYTVLNKPNGATFTPLGLFQWTPGYDKAGSYAVTFRAADALGASDEETVTITVTNVNRAPVWAAAPPRTVKSGSLLNFGIGVTDPDGQPLTKTIVSAPAGLQVVSDAMGVVVRWTPTVAQLGSHSVVLSASDGDLSAQVTAVITVVEDAAPTAVISGPSVMEIGGATYQSTGSSDPEGKALTRAWTLEKGGAVLATGSASSFPVTFDAPGDYLVRLVVADPQGHTGSATLPVRIDDLTTLGLALVGDDGGAYGLTDEPVIRACATWGLDGAPVVGAAVTLAVTLQGPGMTLPIPTQPGASGLTGDDGCVDIALPRDTDAANLAGDHRVDAIVVADSRPTDAIQNAETDNETVHYTVSGL